MTSNSKTARIAGLLYLIVVVTGIFTLEYVPSKLIVWSNLVTTYQNIAANEALFRFGVLSGLVSYIVFLLLPFVLYQLLKVVEKTYALLMVTFAVVSVPISMINIGNEFSILTLIDNASNLNAHGTG